MASPAAVLSQMERAALLAAIREDYDVNYFISGTGAMAAYAPDCTFADPFVSFQGVERFKNNVSNLGGLMSEVRARGALPEARRGPCAGRGLLCEMMPECVAVADLVGCGHAVPPEKPADLWPAAAAVLWHMSSPGCCWEVSMCCAHHSGQPGRGCMQQRMCVVR
jgi:hypothetical protein